MKRATLALASLLGLSACQLETEVGSECESGDCAELRWCAAADQYFPIESCDRETRTCNGAQMPPDREACETCALKNEALGIRNDSRQRCACTYCAVPLAACRDSARLEPDGDIRRDNRCSAVVSCGLGAGCSGLECYCGMDVDIVSCRTQNPAGPCAQILADAAGCALGDLDCIVRASFDPDNALFRASQLSDCIGGDPVLGTEARCPP